MWEVHVENDIDFSDTSVQPDSFFAVMWACACLLGPCRSGGVTFRRLSDVK